MGGVTDDVFTVGSRAGGRPVHTQELQTLGGSPGTAIKTRVVVAVRAVYCCIGYEFQ